MARTPVPTLSNQEARRLFLALHGLGEPPVGPTQGDDLAALIRRLGFVQLDSINIVERAHHMILFARRQSYRPEHLAPLLAPPQGQGRLLFEHWTHDASIIPVEHFPHWRHRFERSTTRLRDNWRTWFGAGYEAKLTEILARVTDHGPLTSSEVGTDEARGKGGWWDWHPSKTALEWLWRTGQLSVLRRDGFQKVYDLTERVIPAAHREVLHQPARMIDWACGSALDRLGFATSGEVAAFWNAVSPEEARDWCRAGLTSGALIKVAVEAADGSLRRSFARPDLPARALAAPEPPGRVRVLSPFDPALRDRARTERLFGFHYRIEVFVPEAKRRYGYYVFPVLEGDRVIGRIDMKAFRAEGELRVRAFWPEPGVLLGPRRLQQILAELRRVAEFAGCERVVFGAGWVREGLRAPPLPPETR